MNDILKVAKMISRSIDSLAREIYLLRSDILHGKELKDMISDLDLDKKDKHDPPP